MSNTCGECKHFELDEIAAFCNKHCLFCKDDSPACEDFEQKVITNGDVIRQMSNEELANRIYNTIHDCFWCPLSQTCDREDGCDCELLLLAWLNAPAESQRDKEEFKEQTLFDRITASPEVLAEKLVYDIEWAWYSTIIPDKGWAMRKEAIAATVAKLKEGEE
jgi:uncharacterized protein YuzB (UPF0349 family)